MAGERITGKVESNRAQKMIAIRNRASQVKLAGLRITMSVFVDLS
jgi:hypothetical protein